MSFLDKNKWLLFVLLIPFCVGVNELYYSLQPVASYQFLLKSDYHKYRAIFDFFTGEVDQYQVAFPFNTRVFLSYLSSLIPVDFLTSTKYINLIFAVLGIYSVILLWREMKINWPLVLMGVFQVSFHWIGIFRYYSSDPVGVDVPLLFIQSMTLIFYLRKQFIPLLVVSIFGVAIKESTIPVLFCITAVAFFYRGKSTSMDYKNLAIILGVSVLTKAVLTYYFPMINPSLKQNSIYTLLANTMHFIREPGLIIKWLASGFLYFGVPLIYTLYTVVKNKLYSEKVVLLGLLTIAYFGMSLLAGGDKTRIIAIGFPFIMTLCFYVFKELDFKIPLAVFLLALPFYRLNEIMVDLGLEKEVWKSWFPEFTALSYSFEILGYCLLSFFVLLLIEKYIGGVSCRVKLKKEEPV